MLTTERVEVGDRTEVVAKPLARNSLAWFLRLPLVYVNIELDHSFIHYCKGTCSTEAFIAMADSLVSSVSSLRSSLQLLDSSIDILDSGVNDFPRLTKVLQTTRVLPTIESN